MSLLTTLAYAITAAIRPMVRDAEVSNLKAQIDDLNGQLADIERDLALTQVECRRWRELAERYIGRAAQQVPAGPNFGLHITEDMRQRMMLATQAQQQMAAAQASALGNQQLAFQNFGQALDDYVRNCTPGRHELFVRGILNNQEPGALN